jgi:predicted PolB exonuclease-like 3'-5' exonuclease
VPDPIIVFDLETVPDLAAVGRALGLDSKPEAEIRAALGNDFPKAPFHSIACIGALVASFRDGAWGVDALGAPHTGERGEAELIEAFLAKIEALKPRLVTFNGHSFDLPVLRYRAMAHALPAPGLSRRAYFNRFSDDAVDLCDVLSSFVPGARAKLHEIAKTLNLPGKPGGIDGSEIETYVRAGRIREVADYCESDVVNTYRIWLRTELFKGTLSAEQHAISERNLAAFLQARHYRNPHL